METCNHFKLNMKGTNIYIKSGDAKVLKSFISKSIP